MAKEKRSLGKGIEALIPGDFDNSILLAEGERVQKIVLETIVPNKHQPRTQFDQQALDGLASSIKKHGILQPVIITPVDNGYMLIAGERRWRAAKTLGLKTIPAIVRSSLGLQQLELALIENIQREDLSSLDQAASILRLHDQFNLTYEQIGKSLGKSQPTVSNWVRLLELPETAKKALRNGEISESHAMAILALKSLPGRQSELLRLIKKHGWSAHQAEQFVVATKSGLNTSSAAKKRTQSTTPATEKLSKHLSAPVTVLNMAHGGRLMISFKSDQDLARIIKRLMS